MRFLLLLLLASCTGRQLYVTVKNPIGIERAELAETDASPFCTRFSDGFVMADMQGVEVPYQITSDGHIVFPVTLAPHGEVRYTVTRGTPSAVRPQVYGRVFPEHKDNMNWENDKAAYVAYGPALQAAGERGYGYDVWTKSVDTLVLEERNRLELEGISMHKDNGNGMDAYIVASSLGGGTAALLDSAGQIIYPWAWREAEVTDNGPLRFRVRLTYHPAAIGSDSTVVETRLITLDAGSHLNHTLVTYEGLTAPREIAVGIVVHQQNPNGYTFNEEEGWMAYRDSTEDTKVGNGVIYLGAVVPASTKAIRYQPVTLQTRDALGHVLAVSDYNGTGYSYYWGSAWSKGSIPPSWERYLANFRLCADNPLTVTIN